MIGKAFAGRFGIIAISRDGIVAPLKIVSRGIGYDTASIAGNGVIYKAEVVDVRPAELNPGTSVIDDFIVVQRDVMAISIKTEAVSLVFV